MTEYCKRCGINLTKLYSDKFDRLEYVKDGFCTSCRVTIYDNGITQK